MFFPGPGRAERLFERPFGLPAQFFVGALRVGPDRLHVAGPSPDDLVVERQPVRPFEALHQFQDRDRRARADIENLVGLLHPPLRHAVDRGYVGFGQVDDVDVVTQAGAVGRVVVVAEDRKAFAQSGGRLGDVGHQILRHAARQFADERRGVGADGVEVAQCDAVQALVGRAAVVQDVFGHLLRVAVGRGGGFAGRLLRDGQCVGLAVDRRRRREEDVWPAELLHQRADVHERREVVAVIFERFGDRLADSLVGGEVDDGAEIVFFEDASQRRFVAGVDPLEGNVDARDAPHTLDGRRLRVGEVVDDDRVVSGGDQFHGGMRADVSGTARNQYSLFCHNLGISCCATDVRFSRSVIPCRR